VAGPITNFLIALVTVAVIVHGPIGVDAFEVLVLLFQVNVILGGCHIFTITTLPASRIVGAFMDDATYARWSALDQYGILFLFGLLFVFRRQFNELINSAYVNIADFMVRVVGG